MRVLIVLGVIFFFNACKMKPLPKDGIITISKINVYKDFWLRGYTSAGAYTHFDDMKKDRVKKISVADEDIKRLEQILNAADWLRHFQRKHPGGLVFCELTFVPGQPESRVLISIGTYDAGVLDLTNWIDYKVTDPEDLKWLRDFKGRMKYL